MHFLFIIIYYYFKRFYLFIFRDGEESGRGRGTSGCAWLSHAPYWGPGPQPWQVPWLGRPALHPLSHSGQDVCIFGVTSLFLIRKWLNQNFHYLMISEVKIMFIQFVTHHKLPCILDMAITVVVSIALKILLYFIFGFVFWWVHVYLCPRTH